MVKRLIPVITPLLMALCSCNSSVGMGLGPQLRINVSRKRDALDLTWRFRNTLRVPIWAQVDLGYDHSVPRPLGFVTPSGELVYALGWFQGGTTRIPHTWRAFGGTIAKIEPGASIGGVIRVPVPYERQMNLGNPYVLDPDEEADSPFQDAVGNVKVVSGIYMVVEYRLWGNDDDAPLVFRLAGTPMERVLARATVGQGLIYGKSLGGIDGSVAMRIAVSNHVAANIPLKVPITFHSPQTSMGLKRAWDD